MNEEMIEEMTEETMESEKQENTVLEKENQNKNEENTQNPTIKRPLSHRIFAWIVIVLLLAMYVITFVAAISGSGSASQLFMMSLGSTVVLPGVLWLHIRLWKHSVEKTLDKHKSM